MAGRKGRLEKEPDLADRIVTAAQTGAPLEVAAQSCGVPPATFWEWMARGEGRTPKGRPSAPRYADFADRVRKAEADAHLLVMGKVRQAAIDGSWQAGVAMAKMRWPKYYAERVEVSGPQGGPVAISPVLEQVPRHVLEEQAALLAEEVGEEEDGEDA